MAGSARQSGGHHGSAPIDVALAEYGFLTDEIRTRLSLQLQVLIFDLTAVGAIVALIYSSHATEHLLLLVMPLSLVFILVWADLGFITLSIGGYVRGQLWPYIRTLHSVGDVPSWEEFLFSVSRRPAWVARAAIPIFACYLAPSAGALTLYGLWDGRSWAALAVEAVVLVLGSPIGAALGYVWFRHGWEAGGE
jgi:hypothetical protein